MIYLINLIILTILGFKDCLVTFAAVLCEDIGNEDVHLGYKVGKLGEMMFLESCRLSMCSDCPFTFILFHTVAGMRLYNEQYSSNLEQLPFVYLMYYGFAASLFEPIQAVIDMHRRACQIGLQMGDKSVVANHKYFMLTRQLHAGETLSLLVGIYCVCICIYTYILYISHVGFGITLFRHQSPCNEKGNRV